MSIKKYAVDQTGTLELKDANEELMLGDDGKPMIVEIYGPGSPQFAKATAEQTNRLMERLKKKGKADIGADEQIKETAQKLAACTKSFSPNIAGDDYPDLADRKLFEAVYADREVGFVAEQVNKFLGDWGNFTKASSTT